MNEKKTAVDAFIGTAVGATVDRLHWTPADPDAMRKNYQTGEIEHKPIKEHVEIAFAVKLNGYMTRRSTRKYMSDAAWKYTEPALKKLGIHVVRGKGIISADPQIYSKVWKVTAKDNPPYGKQWEVNTFEEGVLVDKVAYEYPDNVGSAAPQSPPPQGYGPAAAPAQQYAAAPPAPAPVQAPAPTDVYGAPAAPVQQAPAPQYQGEVGF